MSETNKELVRKVEEAWAKNDLAAIDELIAADLVSHDRPPMLPPGIEGAKAAHEMSMASFPDRSVTVEDIFAEDDRVAVRTTIRGTNTGGVPWLGVPPNGRAVQIESISIYRVADGKAVEHWGQNDVGALMMQLGATPPPAATPAQT
ncbi:MAG: ester cyclase [Candidatus Dormibacteraeota bacterium]|nr:ester cyclase [Candidatus Dormibacteraeota bacterium]